MGTSYGSLCSDFYINQRLALKMDLPNTRETILDLFDRVRKSRPGMERFRRFESELALESAPKDGAYDWFTLKQTSIRCGCVNPHHLDWAYRLHRLVLEVSPYYLSISPLDVDYLELLFGFDLEAKGNHDEIVFDALYAESPLSVLRESDSMTPRDVQPYFTFTAGEDDKTVVNFEIKTRTSAQEIAEDKFQDDPISVYMSLRHMGPISDMEQLQTIFESLSTSAERIANDTLIPALLMPITRVISSRSYE